MQARGRGFEPLKLHMKTMTFELGEADTAQAKKFMVEHQLVCPHKGKYQGAVGVSYTFSFTDTSIGQMSSVKCHCGATEYMSNDI